MKVDLEPDETVAPCPMCGEEASLHDSAVGASQPKKGEAIVPTATLYWCRCDSCGLTQTAMNDRANALARWNRRVK